MSVTVRKLREESDAITYVVTAGSTYSNGAVIRIQRNANNAKGTPTRGAELRLNATNSILDGSGNLLRKQDSSVSRRLSVPAELVQVAVDEQVKILDAMANAVKADTDQGFLPDSTTYTLTLV